MSVTSPNLPISIVRSFEDAQQNFDAIQKRFPLAASLLADGAVTTAKLGDGSVTPAKVSGRLTEWFAPLNRTMGDDVSANFTLAWPATCYFAVSGTGFVNSAATAYLNFWLDGAQRFGIPKFFNVAGAHETLPMGIDGASLGAGVHAVRVSAGGNLTRDFNDVSSVLVIATRTG